MKAAVLFLLATGCVSAQFHSKTGQTFPVVTHQAVIVDDNEAQTITAAGGDVIGTISSDGWATKTAEDLADKAAKVAAANGGTHVVMTDQGEITYTQDHPAVVTRQCTWGDGTQQCEKTFAPPSTTTSSRPTAEFTVLRVPPQRWQSLPPMLRPAR